MRPVNGSPLLSFALAAAVASVISYLGVRLLIRLRMVIDTPNARSLHTSPTPRSGGIGVLAGVLLGSTVSIGIALPVIWISLGLALLSLIDDRWNLPAAARLAGHLAAAVVFMLLLVDVPAMLLWPILILGIAWMTNLFNFMDGADGLAGGMAMFGFGAYAFVAGAQGHNEIAALSLCIATAAAGFLVFNFPPARIFLGDVGSIPIGFLAGAIGVLGWREGAWPPLFPIIVFAPFIVDATVTLAKRVVQRKKVWQAHREHYYQRLILGGWTHRRVAVAEYILMAECAAAGLIVVFAELAAQSLVVAIQALVLTVLIVIIDRRWRLQQRPEAT